MAKKHVDSKKEIKFEEHVKQMAKHKHYNPSMLDGAEGTPKHERTESAAERKLEGE